MSAFSVAELRLLAVADRVIDEEPEDVAARKRREYRECMARKRARLGDAAFRALQATYRQRWRERKTHGR